MMAAVHDSTNSSLVNKLFVGTLARRSSMLIVETELRTVGVFVNVSSQYSRIEPGNISIADSNMGLLFVVVAVQLLDTPASAALSAEKERSASLLLQDDDEASHALLSFDDDINTTSGYESGNNMNRIRRV